MRRKSSIRGEMGRIMKIQVDWSRAGPPLGLGCTISQRANGIIAESEQPRHGLVALVHRQRRRRESTPRRANFQVRQTPARHIRTSTTTCWPISVLPDGTLGEVDGTCPCGYGYDARVEILCENGLLLIGSVAQQGVAKVTLDGQVAGRAVKSWRNLFKDAYLAENGAFC